jgi:hypothetical protein
VISLWQFFFRVLAAEPDVCGRCGGAIAVDDVVVQVRDAGPGRLWHRPCVWASDAEVSGFRRALRRKTHPRATAASSGQVLLFVDCFPGSVSEKENKQEEED